MQSNTFKKKKKNFNIFCEVPFYNSNKVPSVAIRNREYLIAFIKRLPRNKSIKVKKKNKKKIATFMK